MVEQGGRDLRSGTECFLCDAVRIFATGASVAISTLAFVFFLERGIDWYMQRNPCEVTLLPRRASSEIVYPGDTFSVFGVYQIVRDGCTARFSTVMEWTSDLYGSTQVTDGMHMGSVPLDAGEPFEVRRVITMPKDARPGSSWKRRTIGVWDPWGLPFGLSEYWVDYVDVLVTVGGHPKIDEEIEARY